MGFENEKWLDVVTSGISTCIEWGVDVIVLAPGPPASRLQPQEPLQMATRRARDHDIPVLLAAGYLAPGMFQALIPDPWIIPVGAVDVNDRLLADSTIGEEGAAGPVVVSYGIPMAITRYRPKWGEFASHASFAVSRVAGVTAFVRGCLRLMASDASDQQDGVWNNTSRPLKVPLIGVVDSGVEPPPMSAFAPMVIQMERPDLQRFHCSRTDREQRWYAETFRAMKDASATCNVADLPEAVNRALRLLALRLDGYAVHQAGSGLVTFDEAREFFSALTPVRWLSIFCPDVVARLGGDRLKELNERLGPLWDAGKIEQLQALVFDEIRLVIVEVY